MATLKITYRDNEAKITGFVSVKIRLSHKRQTRYINTGIEVLPEQFDNENLVKDHDKAKSHNIKLRNLINSFEEKLLSLGEMKLKQMEINTIVHILRNTEQNSSTTDFLKYLTKEIANIREENRHSTALTYERTLDKLKLIARGELLLWSEITPHFLQGFERKLRLTGSSPTTIAIYMRNIRTVFNKGIADPSISVNHNDYPFREYKIPKGNKRKINIQAVEVQQIINYEPTNAARTKAKDLFLLSFYLIGMNFKDMLLLQHSDIYQGRIIYARAKTGKDLSIKIEPEAMEIINRYRGDKYLLNIMEHKIRRQKKADRKNPLYKDVTDRANRSLKHIATELNMPQRLSTYYARHTWATIARKLEVPTDTIADALSHGTTTVTDLYIEIDWTAVDKANRKVIDSLA